MFGKAIFTLRRGGKILRLKALGKIGIILRAEWNIIVRREHRMIAALIRGLLRQMEGRRAVGRALPVQVDRIEVNHYWWAAGCESHQVILWKWCMHQRCFKPERFFFISDDGSQMLQRVDGRKWRFTYRSPSRKGGWLTFETNDLIETVTAHDPWNRARAG